MHFDYNQAFAFVAALTGDAETVMDWRAIHDRDKAAQAHNARGPLSECWQWLCAYNAQGYGIFAVINETNGQGALVSNVTAVRAHFVDLDNLSAMDNLARACAWYPQPAFAVQSSPNKAHVYWPVDRYLDASRFVSIQKRLIAHFQGDPVIHDLPRVMRVPGFHHCKGEPVLTTCYALPGYANGRIDASLLEVALAGVVAHESGGERHALGDPSKAAPSLDWIKFALSHVDPNTLDRGEWIALTCAVKQAGWTLADAGSLYNLWSEWCGQYAANDPGENLKQWNSIKNTELGWQSIVRRVPAVHAQMMFGASSAGLVSESGEILSSSAVDASTLALPAPVALGEILTPLEQSEYFKGCIFITRLGCIMDEKGQMLGTGAFNALKGGKLFMITNDGKLTDEPWKAATRSTCWTIPKVDQLRFLPHEPYRAIVKDELGRLGVNTYIVPDIRVKKGDPSRFLRHLEAMFPVESDRKILIEYLAHNAKYPGYKIPWAPVIQSTEGTGKGLFKHLIDHMCGECYTHSPSAKDLVDSGSKFNAWMRAKLMIFVDEIKVDERREMIEILKPMISETHIEIQAKGHDQEKEDNYSNWFFATNYKDAIPINKNARRFCVLYSALQSYEDVQRAGFTNEYFQSLYDWARADGYAIVTQWLRDYPIERGAIPMRAPDTSSTIEALQQSRSPYEQVIIEAIEDGIPGFCGGYVSSVAAIRRIKELQGKLVASSTIAKIMESLSYVSLGRADRLHFQEDATSRTTVYAVRAGMDKAGFMSAQGYS